jgi:flagellar assembly protein FliH
MTSSSEFRPGRPVLRGGSAQEAPTAQFGTDLRRGAPVDSKAVAQVKEEARTAGYAEGWAQGQREAAVAAEAAADQARADQIAYAERRDAALRRAIGALSLAAEAAERQTAASAEELQDLILGYAFEIAEAIVGRELTDPETRGLDALRRVMTQVPTSGPVTVSLHPADYAVLDTADLEHDGRPIRLRPNPSLQPGDAIAEIGSMTVDATVATAVARVHEALTR